MLKAVYQRLVMVGMSSRVTGSILNWDGIVGVCLSVCREGQGGGEWEGDTESSGFKEGLWLLYGLTMA